MKQTVKRNDAWELDDPRLSNEELEPEQLTDVEEVVIEPIDEIVVPGEATVDAVQHYLQEIGRVSLLNAAEEVELAERMERGDAARKRLLAGDEVSSSLRAALDADVQSGRDARRHLIQANLRLVVSIASMLAAA